MAFRLKYLLWTVIAVAAAGCSGDVVNSYSAYSTLPDYGWRYTDAQEFQVEHRDSICSGTLLVALRHRGDYPYMDVQVEVAYSDRGINRRDTLTIALADRYGQWLGKGVGTSFQITDTVGRLTHVTGSPVKVRHLMRCDTLTGITQLGIFFVP